MPSDGVEYVSLASKLSLLDYDIAVSDPDISQFYSYADEYLGKPMVPVISPKSPRRQRRTERKPKPISPAQPPLSLE